MRRSLERSYPYAVPALLAGLAWTNGLSFPAGQEILSASITLGAIFTGFLATSKSIVISLQSPRIEVLRKTRFFDLLLSYLQEALWLALLFCALCLGGFFYNSAHPPSWFSWLWVFLAASTFLTFQRVSSILLALIRTA